MISTFVRRTLCLATALSLLAGCASTRSGRFGWLPGQVPLVTLIVTEDLDVVMRECAGLTDRGVVVGCQRSGLAVVDGKRPVRLVKIVRYTDWLPSPIVFEIAGDQLCHTVADVQLLPAVCHAENGGMIEAAIPGPGVQVFLRRP